MRKLLSYTAALTLALVASSVLAQSTQPSTSIYNRNPALLDNKANANFSATQANCLATGAAGSAGPLLLGTQGVSAVSVLVQGATTGSPFTLQIQGAADNINNAPTFKQINAYPVPGGDPVQSISQSGVYQIDSSGFRQICIYASALPTGSSVMVWMEGSVAAAAVGEVQGVPFGFPLNENVSKWGGANALFGPGPSFAQGAGAAARVALSRDANPRLIIDDTLPTYRCSAQFTPQATAAVTLISLKGSATATVRVRKILVSGTAGALGISVFAMQRTTALGAGGTIVSPTIATLDTNFASAGATALCSHYTATLKAAGTPAGGPLGTWVQFFDTVTTPTVATRLPDIVFPEGGVPGQSIVLRGTGDFLEIQNVTPTNLGGTTLISYTIEWVEDSS